MCSTRFVIPRKKKKAEKKVSRSIVGGEMNAPAKNVQRAANESDHRGFPRELHELVERRCRRRRRRALPSATPTPRRALPSPRAVASRRHRAAHCRRPEPLPPRPPPAPLIARAGLAALQREASRELGTIAGHYSCRRAAMRAAGAFA